MALKELVEKLKSKGWIVYYPADVNKIKEHTRRVIYNGKKNT